MEGNRNILIYGLPIVTLVVLAVLLLHGAYPGAATVILYILLLTSSIFIVFLVLIQRGKGGGLAGALGGMGGSSAFGTRAGDVFTMITIVAAGFWILSAMALAKINLAGTQDKYQGATVEPSKKTPGTAPIEKPGDGATDGEKSESLPSNATPAEPTGILQEKSGKKSDPDKESN